jgi:aspartate/methionine/tyrosine aminotransferase
MASYIKPGDVVLVESPAYEPLFRIPTLLGARVEYMNRIPQDNYHIDIEGVKDVISKKVSMIVTTNPHNPSSELSSNEHLKELCDIAEDNDCHLLCDEVYRDFVFNDPPKQAWEMSDRAITTNSLTKVFGLASLRAGWIFANPQIIEKCLKMKYHTSVICSPVTEKLAYNALKESHKFIENTKKLLDTNVPIIQKWVETQPYLDLSFPKYGPFCFPRFKGINVTELSDMLINYYDTIIVPGKFFGASDFARIGFGIPTDKLEAGLENIENAVNAISG